MRRIVLVGVLALAAAVAPALMAAETVPELFTKVKEQVKAEKWNDALVTMEVIDTEAAKPANAQFRAPLEGPLAFYRGVCDANLGNADKAQSDFEAFLRTKPDAGIDDKVYSKKAVAAFAAAQKSIASAGPSIARAYAEFKPPGNISEPASPTWGDGPVRWLMTDAEKAGWAAATTDADRAAFVDKFWKARDLEDDHSFKPNFEKRVAFADANFSQDEKRGSLTDRGMVFVLIGPPTYAGRRRIGAQEDKSEHAGMSSVGDHDSTIAQKQAQGQAYKDSQKAVGASGSGKVSTTQMASLDDQYSGPGVRAANPDLDYQEVWHFKKDTLPKGVNYIQVDAVFITKKGYGKNVLQRDPDVLATLDAAKQKPQ
jgi:GWxTD domain-containing protein